MNGIINKLTVEEKIALVSGTDFMHTNPVPRLGIPSLCMADGPHGLRKQITGGDNGVSQSEPATSFPTAAATASSWNPENTRKMGEAIAKECRAYGVNVLLGPGVNIKRNPLCGRNFEYFSEDPFLASEMAIGEVQGVQSQGVAVSVKHFALNN
ncbi:MAG: glycoside hydrolase family 3 protein, partial [Clostridia bacterium]|nr:glycoside hydrolase family 3 protein [Clostridia bacterium]